MKNLLKYLYFKIPFKRTFFSLLKKIWDPSIETAGYLKFDDTFSLSVNGKKLYIQNKNLTIPTLLFWKGVAGYEPMTLQVWQELSIRSKVIFDVGSNFGLFALLAKLANGEAMVTAFEPLKRNSQLIEKNCRCNDMNIGIEEIALSDHEGVATFYDMDSFDNTIGSFNEDFVKRHRHHKALNAIEVKTDTVDNYCLTRDIDTIDLLKLDVEGAEEMVIMGATGMIKKSFPCLIVEISDENSFDRIKKRILNLHKYKIYRIDEDQMILEPDPTGKNQSRNFLFFPEESLPFSFN